MAFRFKDLMIQVVPTDGGDGICTIATKPDPEAAMPCTIATKPAAAAMPCTIATKPAALPCTIATKPAAIPGICTIATRPTDLLAGATPITTVTTVTTVTTLVEGLGGSAGLAALRDQLQQALAELAGQDAGLPATVEETADLERKLKDAVKELQEHRKTLEKGSKGGKGGKK